MTSSSVQKLLREISYKYHRQYIKDCYSYDGTYLIVDMFGKTYSSPDENEICTIVKHATYTYEVIGIVYDGNGFKYELEVFEGKPRFGKRNENISRNEFLDGFIVENAMQIEDVLPTNPEFKALDVFVNKVNDYYEKISCNGYIRVDISETNDFNHVLSEADNVIDSILSTCLHEQFASTLMRLREEFETSIKINDIDGCYILMRKMNNQFVAIEKYCRAIGEYV